MLTQTLFKKMSQGGPASRQSLESGPFVFHYIIEGGVCYLTLTDKSYPKKLAYQYLEELHAEFSKLYGQEIDKVARPYAFIKFGEDALSEAYAFTLDRSKPPCGHPNAG